jgi:hypothetical protein
LLTLQTLKKHSVRKLSAMTLVGAISLVSVVVGETAFASDPACGPKVGAVHQVSTPAQLQAVGSGGDGVGDCGLGASYLQINDITLTSAWTPVPQVFTGTFDGGNFSISGLQVNGGGTSNQGMFRDLSGTVTRVNLVGASVTSNNGTLGTLVGFIASSGVVSYSHASGSVSGTGNLGGLVGVSMGSISDSSAAVTISGTSGNVGGLLGQNEGGSVEDSHATGSVTSTSNSVGGLVGYSRTNNVAVGGSISASFATGSVTGEDSVGGLVGLLESATITESYSSSVVSANGAAGGLVGWMKDEWQPDDGPPVGAKVDYSYASGSVTSTDDYVGGLVGLSRRSDIFASYASGAVVGQDDVGGLAGYFSGQIVQAYSVGSVRATGDDAEVGGFLGFDDGADLIANFWDVQTSGFSTSAGQAPTKLEGLSSQVMKTITPYTASALVEAAWGIVPASQFSAPLNNASPPPSPLAKPDGTPLDETWGIGLSVNSGYPFLWWQTGDAITISSVASTGSSATTSAITGTLAATGPSESFSLVAGPLAALLLLLGVGLVIARRFSSQMSSTLGRKADTKK